MAVQMKKDARKSKESKQKAAPKDDVLDDLEIDSDDDLQDIKVIDEGFLGSREDSAESRSVACRERIRRQMENDLQAFLAKGGAIQKIAPNVMADPPRKPSAAYGSRPI